MDPRRFCAPIQCALCDLLLSTLHDVKQHVAYHESLNFLCHCCLTNFDSMKALCGHMNQKGAHLRKPLDFTTYTSSLPSPVSCTATVLPLSQPASQPSPTLPATSPAATVDLSDDLTIDQIMQTFVTPDPVQPAAETDTSASSTGIQPFQPQAASTRKHSFVSPDVSPTVGARHRTTASYPPAEYRQLGQQNTKQKLLLWWCLHHLKSLPAPPHSAGGEFDLALRRVLRQTEIKPPQFDENSAFED